MQDMTLEMPAELDTNAPTDGTTTRDLGGGSSHGQAKHVTTPLPWTP